MGTISYVHNTASVVKFDKGVATKAADTMDYAVSRPTAFQQDLVALVKDAYKAINSYHANTTKYQSSTTGKIQSLGIVSKPLQQAHGKTAKEGAKHSNNRPVDLWAQLFVYVVLANYDPTATDDKGIDKYIPCNIQRYAQLAGEKLPEFVGRVHTAMDGIATRSRGLHLFMNSEGITLQCDEHDDTYGNLYENTADVLAHVASTDADTDATAA